MIIIFELYTLSCVMCHRNKIAIIFNIFYVILYSFYFLYLKIFKIFKNCNSHGLAVANVH